jgi:hypothetical protein
VLDEDVATQWTSAMTGVVRTVELRKEPDVDAVMVEDVVADVEPHDGITRRLWRVCGFADVALGVGGLEVIAGFRVNLEGGRGNGLCGHRGSWACVTIELLVVEDSAKIEVEGEVRMEVLKLGRGEVREAFW